MENRTKIYTILMSEPSEALSEKSIADLSEIADEPRGQSRYYARAILSSQGYYYPPVITSPIDLQSFGNSNNKTEEAENQKKLVDSLVLRTSLVEKVDGTRLLGSELAVNRMAIGG